MRVLVISGSWCGDCVRQGPMIRQIADACDDSVELRVIDRDGAPISCAKITIAGWGAYRTNKAGYARFYLPRDDVFALIIEGQNQEEVLYEEQMAPGKTYVYRPDAAVSSGRIFILATE